MSHGLWIVKLLVLLAFCGFLLVCFFRGSKYSTWIFVGDTSSCLLISHNAIYIMGVTELRNPFPIRVFLPNWHQ
jgi:hypothetical protein